MSESSKFIPWRNTMAQFPKVNPVVDGNSGAFFGKNVDYIEINFGPATGQGDGTLTGNILSSYNQGPNGAWPAIINIIEQVATIEVLGTISANAALLSRNGGNANLGVRMITSGVNAAPSSILASLLATSGPYGNGFYSNSSVSNSTVNLSTMTTANVQVTTIGNVQGVAGSATFYF